MTPTTIASLTFAKLDMPLHEPFGIAGGAQDVAHNLLVTLTLADGTRGYGEAAPFAAFNGETQDDALAALETAHGTLLGADARAWRPLAAALKQQIGHSGAARCALETALLDALTRSLGLPLWAFFGGASTRLITDMTVTTGTPEQAAAAAAKIVARGIHTIKIKVGGGSPAYDLERIVAIHAAAPHAALTLDGNGGMSADGALELLTSLRERQITITMLEQPVPRSDFAGMVRLAAVAGVPLAADESLASAADALQIWQHKAAHVLNIKLMKSGVVEALDIAAVARASGLDLMVGGMVEGPLAMSMSACFAAGLGGFLVVDLDTPLFLAEHPFSGGMVYDGDQILLDGITAGHGVTPTRATT